MASERRKQRRIPVRIDSHWKSNSKSGMGHVSNLSAGGCRVTCGLPLAEGDQAVLTIYFDRDGAMTLSGRVVSTGPKGVGVKFENMTPSLRFQIGEILHSLN
ncbi:MAG TPA: PilZ domain-containing protein [Vicinamibacterales bacterium]|nr:PilZ domain-containing protein [Vicinamibacterales bacterium]